MGKAIDLPANLDEWTYDTVVAIVKKYEFEPGSFDYKAVLHATDPVYRDKHNASIRRTTCSLANADGGFILFGVQDRNIPVNSPEDRIIGIPLGNDLRKIFSDKISSLQRPVYFEASQKPLVLSTNPMRGIFVVYIPQSQLRPHMDESTGNFYRRGEGGNADIMKFYEVREQMMYTEDRLQKVTLLRLEIAQYQEIITEMLMVGPYAVVTRYRFDTGAFKVLLADISSLIPPRTDILRKLLRIPLQANVINQSIYPASWANEQDVAADQASFAWQAREIKRNLESLRELLTLCESYLAKIFGPLEGGKL
jgi:hypothetical protein